ncbi:MAG: response regulator transcription factor [Candidatus Sericytochromatia bacterium]|nr:response regulator transcription factor [Candidatus Sericytochromatia bacterium]
MPFSQTGHSILVIEDDPSLLECIKMVLESECLHVQCAKNGSTALKKLEEQVFNLVLIDMHLPDIFGLELFRTIKARKPEIPCIFLSAHQIEVDIVLSLQLGAEDYIIKPFKAGELLARIRKVLNRPPVKKDKSELPHNTQNLLLEFGCLKLISKSREVYLKQQKVNLTKTEFEILYFLASYPQEVITRQKIIDQIWLPEDDVTDRIIDSHIRQIRSKLKQVFPYAEQFIMTSRGVGYYFNPKMCE